MKPKNLKYPFPWEQRRIVIHDRVWFVPDHYHDYASFHFPGWCHQDLFGNTQPVNIEYCSGNGTWIAEKALAHPEINWVAVEKRFVRVRKIWSKVKNLSLNNLIVICGEGHNLTSHYIPDSSVQQVFINFPDPWPKKKHAKHRIINFSFTKELWRIIKIHGTLTLVTDDPDYSEEMIEVMQQRDGFPSVHPEPYYVTQLENYGTSYFDQLWREKGKVIRYHQYCKHRPPDL